FVFAASSAGVIGPAASALYSPSRSPMTTIPVWTAAPKSPTNRPTKAFSLSISSAVCGVLAIKFLQVDAFGQIPMQRGNPPRQDFAADSAPRKHGSQERAVKFGLGTRGIPGKSLPETRAISANAKDDAVSAALWPRSGGCAH